VREEAPPVDERAQQSPISRILRCMTPNPRIESVLRVYSDYPLHDGDAVLLLDETVCLELEQLATQWDDVLRTNTAEVVRRTARTVVVAIARSGGDLHPSDFRLWRELHDELRHDDIDLAPLQSLPAA
jgi:hypothetical protein